MTLEKKAKKVGDALLWEVEAGGSFEPRNLETSNSETLNPKTKQRR